MSCWGRGALWALNFVCGVVGGGIHITKEGPGYPTATKAQLPLSRALLRAPRGVSIPVPDNGGLRAAGPRAPCGAPPALPGAAALWAAFPGEGGGGGAERTELGPHVPGKSPGRGWREEWKPQCREQKASILGASKVRFSRAGNMRKSAGLELRAPKAVKDVVEKWVENAY